MESNKDFIVGLDYQLKAFPKAICTYTGNCIGFGTNREGNFRKDINMEVYSDWSHLVKDTLTPKAVDIRQFDTGANRNSDEGKLDFEGFLSPTVLEAYAEYMHEMRHLENGEYRDSDNWQKGIPKTAYMKSMYRHFFDVWKNHRGIKTKEDDITNLCGLLFNVMGMIHEKLKEEKI